MISHTSSRARRFPAGAGSVVIAALAIVLAGCGAGGSGPSTVSDPASSVAGDRMHGQSGSAEPSRLPSSAAPATAEAEDAAVTWDAPELVAPLGRSEPVAVRIPALDVRQHTTRVGVDTDGVMEVPQGPEPVGWYVHSPTPGERGPSVLIGHVTWNGIDGVFRDLGQLQPGDTASVERADGTTAAFEVTRVEQYPKGEFPTARVYGNTANPELRLITCSGDYDPSTRSFSDNTVVYARMGGS